VELERIRLRAAEAAPLFEVDPEREAAADRTVSRFLRLVRRLWRAYDSAKRERGVLDNNDLQAEAVHLLESSPGALRRCRRRFKHIMVDECQDTDPLQMRLVTLLAGRDWEPGIAECGVRIADGSDSRSPNPSPRSPAPRHVRGSWDAD
jgi:ATP-dependent exoDNAse (exonuclease V) beta subunit